MPYRPTNRDFVRWLHQSVWVSGDQKALRKDWIPWFADSLTRWMEEKGYKMDGYWKKGHMAVARWLYAIQVQVIANKEQYGPLRYPEVKHRAWPEDRDAFELEVSDPELEKFLGEWQLVEDLDIHTPSGQRVLCELRQLLWTYIELESCRQGKRVARVVDAMGESEEDASSVDEARMEGLFGSRSWGY